MTLPRPVSILLWPAALLYGVASSTRVKLYEKGWLKQKRLKAAVISVGNLSVGGTGKTPMVMWLAERLTGQGKRVGILTRGYRGKGRSSDELELMRSRLGDRVVFGVGKDRYARGQAIESRQPVDVFLLDDGFQHLQLARDLDIMLMDATRTYGGQFLLPAGPMREKVSAVDRADVIVFTRTGNSAAAKEAIQQFSKLPIFAASTKLFGFRPLENKGPLQSRGEIGMGPFFAFCGIGNPGAFESDLKSWGVPLAGQMVFGDHHRYTTEDVRKIEAHAMGRGATALITTEKDSWNVSDVHFSLPVFVSIIGIEITGEAAFIAAIGHLLQARGALA